MSRARGLGMLGAFALAMIAVVVRYRGAVDATCADGFTRSGARCMPSASCPAPLVTSAHGCDVPPGARVLVPAVTLTIGPSDWEAEGRVKPRTLQVGAFYMDLFEVTNGRLSGATSDPARAASGVTFEEARAFCRKSGGRLPTEDEWIAAASGDRARRYPWGDTGAVCRRAAWGIARGPCAEGADGPDTAGAHPDGRTPLGIQDLAGNVAEWTETGGAPAVRGGSWRTELATELRTWARREAPPGDRDPTIGFRCAYDVAVRSVTP